MRYCKFDTGSRGLCSTYKRGEIILFYTLYVESVFSRFDSLNFAADTNIEGFITTECLGNRRACSIYGSCIHVLNSTASRDFHGTICHNSRGVCPISQ